MITEDFTQQESHGKPIDLWLFVILQQQYLADLATSVFHLFLSQQKALNDKIKSQDHEKMFVVNLLKLSYYFIKLF